MEFPYHVLKEAERRDCDEAGTKKLSARLNMPRGFGLLSANMAYFATFAAVPNSIDVPTKIGRRCKELDVTAHWILGLRPSGA